MWHSSDTGSKKGFTLIEVMVVISIIGILVSILVLSFDEARKNSRDNSRKASLKQMQLAIETYKAQNGTYPPAGCGVTYPQWAGSESSYSASTVTSCPSDYVSGIAPSFIGALPAEPGATKASKGFVYRVAADGSSYKLLSYHNVENQTVTGYGDEFARYPNSTAGVLTNDMDVYAVYSKGAEAW